MNTPGVSLFQGAESIKINSSLEREEEEEALKDERRRKEELDFVMQNAFDDLNDDETTIDSTTNFPAGIAEENGEASQTRHDQNHCVEENQFTHPYGNLVSNGYAGTHQPVDHSGCEQQIHHLKMLVESRSRELEHSSVLLAKEAKKSNELQKKLSIVEAELDRALRSKKNNHELLVESKEKISNLETAITKISLERKTLETEKNGLLGKLETVQNLLSDAERKYDMVEKDLNRNQEKNFEFKRKQMEERHRAGIEVLQQQIEQLAEKLDKNSADLESMDTRYQALQQTHQLMLCDKASKINDLSHALDVSQKRCEEYLSRPDYFLENVRLQKLVSSLQVQIQDMEKTINNLKQHLELTTAELDSMDTALHQCNQEDTPRRLSNQSHGCIVGSTPLNPLDRVSALKDELYRALGNIKNKRNEIRKMQLALDEKQAEIKQLKQEENKSLVQISTLREEHIKLQNKLKVLEEEFDQIKNGQDGLAPHEDNLVQDLQEQLKNAKEQLILETDKSNDLEQYKEQQEKERKKLDVQLKNLEIDLEELKQEHESLKLNNEQILKENNALKQRLTADKTHLELERHKFLLKDSQAECDRFKNLYVEISKEKEALSYEYEQLLKTDKEKEMQEEKAKVANLQRALQLAEIKCSELSKILETDKLCHERELADVRGKLEKAKMGTDKANKEAANECVKCLDYVAQLTKFEIQNLKLANINDVNKKEIDELTKELKSSKDYVAELNEQLKLSKEQDHLIKVLKTKASQFEEYIKSYSSASEGSNNSLKSNKSVETSPELERNEIKKIESRIRDEMAKIFVIELKRFQTKLQEAHEQNFTLKREYQYINGELQQRQAEVQALKQLILEERLQMDEILKEKDETHQDTAQKLNVTLQKIHDELETKAHKVKELTNELNERQAQIEAERRSMKAVMKQWEEQRKSIDAVEMDWKQKFADLRKAHASALQSWETKYNSAKRTAANYKRYSEDKEAHMLKEYDRLKAEYDAQLAKIQLRVKESLEKKTLELKQALVDKQRGINNNNNNNKENTAIN